MSEWAGPCVKCGHPSSYHGMTFCIHQSGAETKRTCDCDGYVERPQGEHPGRVQMWDQEGTPPGETVWVSPVVHEAGGQS